MATALKRRPAQQEQLNGAAPPACVFKSLGELCQKVAHQARAKGHQIITKAMGTTVGQDGGYLIPPELLIDVCSVLQEQSIFHRFALNTPMASSTQYLPSYDLNVSHVLGTTPLYGGLSLTWVQENATIPESAPTFAQSQLVSKNLIANVLASDQLIDDGGPPLEAFLRHGFALAIQWAVERACFRGDVANQPEGVVTSPASASAARQTGGTVTSQDLATMASKLVPACYSRAIWCYHPTVALKIAQLAQYQISEPGPFGLVSILNGRPAYPTEKLPSIGNMGDVVLFDPTQYVLGTRQVEIEAAPSIHTVKYSTRQTIFRLIWRGDGKFLARGTATLEDNSTTVGVSVVLAA